MSERGIHYSFGDSICYMICCCSVRSMLPINEIRFSIDPCKPQFRGKDRSKPHESVDKNFEFSSRIRLLSVSPKRSSLITMEYSRSNAQPTPPPTTTGVSISSMVLITSGARSGRVNAVLLSLRALKSLVMLINAFLLLLLLPFQGQYWKRCISMTVSAEKPNKDDHQKHHQEIVISRHGRKSSPVLRVPASTIVPAAARRNNSSAAGDQDCAITRRAIAIRRATQDDEDEGDFRSVREVFLFATSRGDTLFTQSWTPPVSNITIKGTVVLLHGLNEHSGRYNNFAKQLNANGYKVYGMDWIGHGGSDGLHAYVHSLDDAVTDVKAFLEKVVAENPGFPCFCFGHSTGAAIVLKAVMDPKTETLIEGVVLTSPAVRVQPSHPIVGVIAPIFSFLLPKYQFSAANKKGMPVSRDPDALVTKYSDPLVYTGSIRVRTGYEILRVSAYLQKNLSRLTVPFLVLHGTADTVTDPEASKKLYEAASSTDKSIKLYEGYLHDLLFEPEHEAIIKEIIDWLNSRSIKV